MKKYFLLLAALLSAHCVFAQVQVTEPLILINPWRETFLNFPSNTLPGKTVTFFLPEEKQPLQGRYPVVYVLGAIPKDAPAVFHFIQRANPKPLVVGINLTQEDLADAGRVTRFLRRN